ncbi:MAG: BON domain-containing protein [Methylohalobius sp.]|nr:BON domain-containing protein [Methylohalobius sp.]
MSLNDSLVKAVAAAFEIDPQVNPHRDRIAIAHQGGQIVLTGEVADISAKRRAYYAALAVPGVTAVDDRLQVKPAEAMGDAEILTHLLKMLGEDLAFKHYSLVAITPKGEQEVLRRLDDQAGFFRVQVEGGTVYLGGEVRSLCDRRLAEVMAWWVPGSCNVVNQLQVTPPEEDNDDQLKEAILLALDVDPFVDYLQLAIQCRAGEVVLDGVVPVAEQIKLAEHDCWYVEGVKKVDNRLRLP